MLRSLRMDVSTRSVFPDGHDQWHSHSFCHQLIHLYFDPGRKMGYAEETHTDKKRWRGVHLGFAVDETLQTGLGHEVCETFDREANRCTWTDPDGGVLWEEGQYFVADCAHRGRLQRLNESCRISRMQQRGHVDKEGWPSSGDDVFCW